MAINTKKVLVGGLAAGVVLNVIDWLANGVLMADRMKAEADAFRPGLGDAMMQGSSIAIYVISDLVIGIMLVWTYAAIRPRFGPGPKTALQAALLFWILGAIMMAGYLQMGLMSMGLWWTVAIILLVNLSLAAWVGAMLYTEEGTPGAAA
jgi:hypothetical protein